ncbi:MAG: hypothetical protein KBD47_00365 [Candidatus Pacebacteria bacterium]|nr:hypothetical protein [Candidatus Paceibacterota bacterium]
MIRLQKMGTRYIAPPMFEAASLAQTKYLRDLIGDAYEHYIMKYDGERMDSIRAEEEHARLKPLMFAYAYSDAFKTNIDVCKDLIQQFKQKLHDKVSIPELVDSFARLYVHAVVPYYISNMWSADIQNDRSEEIINRCRIYRELVDTALEPFYKAVEHVPVPDTFIFHSGAYVPLSWDEFLKKNNFEYVEEVVEKVKEIKGNVAYKGNVKGIAKIILSPKDFHKLNEGDILVAPMTTPLYLPILHKAAGIVTDEGGVTSHAAIIARELKKPCITGTKIATQCIRDGNVIYINTERNSIKLVN